MCTSCSSMRTLSHPKGLSVRSLQQLTHKPDFVLLRSALVMLPKWIKISFFLHFLNTISVLWTFMLAWRHGTNGLIWQPSAITATSSWKVNGACLRTPVLKSLWRWIPINTSKYQGEFCFLELLLSAFTCNRSEGASSAQKLLDEY